MTWLDRILWPVLMTGDAAYILALILIPLAEAAVCVTVENRDVAVLAALGLAFAVFMLSESRLRLHLWQARCDTACLKRTRLPTVDMRVSRSQPSDWDDT